MPLSNKPLSKQTYVDALSAHPSAAAVMDLQEELIGLWCEEYRINCTADLCEIKFDGAKGAYNSYIFDLKAERTVVAFGMPLYMWRKRPSMGSYPEHPDKRYVKGHLFGDKIGGRMELNIVPQLGATNNGAFKSIEGRVYRLSRQSPSCFYFVRPIYRSSSQTPDLIEQCAIDYSKTHPPSSTTAKAICKPSAGPPQPLQDENSAFNVRNRTLNTKNRTITVA